MADFLFHKVTEKEKREIREQAKKIMQDFSKKLEEVDKEISEPIIDRPKKERVEETPKKPNQEFRKIMFENAPNKNKDSILAEKKQW
ncbi:MAG: hypothetical protein OQK82_08930 [Candidatus Pacearchaeota archaeon]|nr:hypothetical protein [Candidatus Pacearchaeota archaeon]